MRQSGVLRIKTQFCLATRRRAKVDLRGGAAFVHGHEQAVRVQWRCDRVVARDHAVAELAGGHSCQVTAATGEAGADGQPLSQLRRSLRVHAREGSLGELARRRPLAPDRSERVGYAIYHWPQLAERPFCTWLVTHARAAYVLRAPAERRRLAIRQGNE
eukprot:scaffold14161_cov46-Phaeocystis_antarctica.AAC.1